MSFNYGLRTTPVVARSPDRATRPDRRSPGARATRWMSWRPTVSGSGTVRRPCHLIGLRTTDYGLRTMDLSYLIEELSNPNAYPFPVSNVEVRQTHISVVFLAGPYAYKIKKPVQFGFLDFGTLEKRHHFCEEEVRLNRRLAADVYLGVVPVTTSESGLQMEGEREPVEWAVKMQRLPDETTLEKRLRKGEAD